MAYLVVSDQTDLRLYLAALPRYLYPMAFISAFLTCMPLWSSLSLLLELSDLLLGV